MESHNIRAIIVGGYVRDYFLNLTKPSFISKDIDIELYGVKSFEDLENILSKFGILNNVGKSFGVCKLTMKNLEVDFTLPRTDSKIGSGHKGFEIHIDNTLSFKEASSRRDFTMNAIGYDVIEKKIIDPFDGIKDIHNKTLQMVSLESFEEDPLRVYRAIGFAARFNLCLTTELFCLCQKMCQNNSLSELANERVFEELKKIFLKSESPSIAFKLLKKMNGLAYLTPLNLLNEEKFLNLMDSIDTFAKMKTKDKSVNVLLFLALLSSYFTKEQTLLFLTHLTNENNLHKKIIELTHTLLLDSYTDSQLLRLATQVNIEVFILFSKAKSKNISSYDFENLYARAKNLNILNTQEASFLKGKDILNAGVLPSKEYSTILLKAYTAQINLEIRSREEALMWLNKYLGRT